ncbi:MAG: S41 family peptidase [Elusimicrobiales bacterium]|nr:S41 family peptidase [Elusimicrobiales bacterium]
MKKLLLILISAAACTGKLPEQEVQKIFSRHSCEAHAPEAVSAALKDGAAGLARLDPRAAVLKGRKPLKARPSGKNISSGLLLGERGGGLVLLKVFSGSPAEAAGFRDGDLVTAINGAAPTAEAVKDGIGRNTRYVLRGERPGAPGVLEGEVARGSFFFPQIFAFYDEGSRTAFLRLGLFFEGSSEVALAAAAAAAERGAQALVIDVRDNQGGVPGEAAAVLKAFAAKPGPVLEVRSRHAGYSSLFAAGARGRFAGLRTAVLVNAGTARAAEVFAAGLRETAGAVLIGEKTAGSVSLQRAFSLGDGRGLELTVARMFPPSGVNLEGAGAAPDAAAGEPGAGRVWDNSREATLLGDGPWLKALELLRDAAAPARRR